MTDDIYTVVILALLPLTAGMLVAQENPYQALVMRGILGAIAALVYALFGAADVALTEALVGTMLSITLYAIAVRSSMSMRLGLIPAADHDSSVYESLLVSLRTQLKHKHLRLEVVEFKHESALQTALAQKEIHAALVTSDVEHTQQLSESSCCLQIRVHRLYEILKASHGYVNLTFTDVENINVSGKKS